MLVTGETIRVALWGVCMHADSCAKCGSKALLVGGGLSADGSVQIRFYKRPNQVFFPGPVLAEIRLQVCADCGYTEMYAQNPRELLKAFPERRETPEET